MLVFNGKEQEYNPELKTIADFVLDSKMNPDGLVVLLNDVVIKKEMWNSTKIESGVSIDFINFVSGG